MATIGTDCHIILQHPAVNGGAGVGFILSPDSTQTRPEGFEITREVTTLLIGGEVAGEGLRIWIYFDVLLADDLLNPDGSIHSLARLPAYSLLMQFLNQTAGIRLDTLIGAFTNLGALGFTVTERHTPKKSLLKCQLNNAGYYFPPVDPTILDQSIWDGPLTWSTSYWR